MKAKVQEVIDKYIKPLLEADGGSIELIDVTDDGIVKVRLTGACAGCPMSQITLKQGVEYTLKEHIKEIKEVISL